MALAAGTRLTHYEIIAQLGAGGMGEVYLAEDTKLSRKVALKLLPAAFTQDAARVRRFVQEAKAASALNHPNILTIHEIGEANGAHYIATEFIDGETLRQRLTGAGLALHAALEVAAQIAAALAAAHSAGIIHRDIKPENVMRRRDGIVKVLDFGLAKLTERRGDRETGGRGEEEPTLALPPDRPVAESPRLPVRTDPGTVMGTASYMSPEQARGQEVDARSDIFSLGVVLYEMLAGRAPFAGVNALEVISEILKTEPAPLRQHAPDAPAELQRIVTKALRKEREERYQVVKDLLLDLKSLKQELEFEAKLKGVQAFVVPPSGGSGVTHAIPPEGGTTNAQPAEAATNEVTAARTTSSAAIILGEMKRHKLGVALALVLLFAALAALSYFVFFARRDSGPIDSIAVLPFVNQNHDPETEYRSDGVTESIINSLTQLPSLRVSPRSTVFHYKGKETDPLAVGKELGARAVLTGRIMQRGDNLSISVELVDVRENKQLWGEHYEGKVSDLLAVQQKIAKEISANLRLKLSGAEQSRVTKHYTENPEAYQLYLKGRFYWNKRTGEALKKSIEYFNQAIEKDPSYALAYAGLSDAYGLLPAYSAGSPQESYPKAKAAAKRALELDETLAEAHASLAHVLSGYDWNFPESNREFQRAIALNPNYATAHHWYGCNNLLVMERFDEAIAEGKRAQELDPLSLVINADLGQDYTYARQYDKAIEQLRKTVEMDQSFYYAHWNLGIAYELKGSFPEAIAEYQKARQLNDDPSLLALLGHVYAASGQRDEALKTLDQLKEIAKQRYVSAYSFAILYTALGEKDQALNWLERGYQDRASEMTVLKVDPFFDNLRSDPRFAELVRRVGLPE